MFLAATLIAMTTARAVLAGTGYGQVTLVNQTGQMLDLYVDDHYGCRALAGLTCTTMETAGSHLLTVKASDGQETSAAIELEEGGTYTYTITQD